LQSLLQSWPIFHGQKDARPQMKHFIMITAVCNDRHMSLLYSLAPGKEVHPSAAPTNAGLKIISVKANQGVALDVEYFHAISNTKIAEGGRPPLSSH
jgi:hypothetical protein